MTVNPQLVIAVVSLLADLVGKLSNSRQVDNAITVLEAWLPVILKEFQDLVPVVQGIIETLQGKSVLTTDQIEKVDALNAKVDADFESAATAASK